MSHQTHWAAQLYEGTWFAALEDQHHHAIRMHPIGFDTEREAQRAASRLNVRDDDELEQAEAL